MLETITIVSNSIVIMAIVALYRKVNDQILILEEMPYY
jgi:hypothetical protein